MKTGNALIKDINSCRLEKGEVAFWWLGQLGYTVKMGDIVIYIDPYLSDNPSRNIPPLLKPEEISNADYIFGTHDHIDHIDRAVWKELSISSPKAKFIVPKLLLKELARDLGIDEIKFIGLDDMITVIDKELKITGIASAHEFLDRDLKTGSYPYLGYLIEGNNAVVYHSGDTCIYEGLYSKLKSFGDIDLMFIPINGRDAKRYRENCIGNMTYQEAVDLAGYINPSLVVPGHYEMFSSNSEDPKLFTDYLQAKYPGVDCWVGSHGGQTLIKKRK
jgi:L-ascorbate 6-phosphate lactonase